MKKINKLNKGDLLWVGRDSVAWAPCETVQEFINVKTCRVKENSVVIFLAPAGLLNEETFGMTHEGKFLSVLYEDKVVWLDAYMYGSVIKQVANSLEVKKYIEEFMQKSFGNSV